MVKSEMPNNKCQNVCSSYSPAVTGSEKQMQDTSELSSENINIEVLAKLWVQQVLPSERTMSTVSMDNRFQRRPSFWKTPIPRNDGKFTGTKRNYSQIANTPLAVDPANPNKKRRILSDDEVISLAKEGRFNPSSIILAVEDETGFCWFKRIETNPSSKSTDRALRELTKKELTERAAVRTAAKSNISNDAQSNGPNDSNSNTQQTDSVHNAVSSKSSNALTVKISKAAKQRRFTAPPQVLQSIVEQQELKEQQSKAVNDGDTDQKVKGKRRKKKKVKRRKKVICYEEKRQIVRKKVHRKKRVLRKKTTHSQTIRITNDWEETAVPDFPPPEMALSVRRYLHEHDAVTAVQEVELSLIEGFVIPLTKCYGNTGNLSFITRAVLQYLMELRNNIEALALAVDVEVVQVPVSSAIAPVVSAGANVKAIGPPPSDDIKEEEQHKEHKEDLRDLGDEAAFYEHQLAMLEQFEQGLCGEIAFTERIQSELKDAEFLRAVFDFDLEADSDVVRDAVTEKVGVLGVGDDEEFVDRMASEIDGLWSEYAADLHSIGIAQKHFEAELVRREAEQAKMARLYVRDSEEREREEQWALEAEDTLTGDRMAFSNFVASNKHNDFTEDDTMHCINYLKDDSMMVIAEE